ncbi:long-chain acyl-CoA synthetase [Mangrovibacterium marinum]|uniref:Long-chain acyl-CoA synthetase n=1 Tax=Mangrovibacterium marinum TaxID=1639118 RepID=A0A2T5C238_9BACT|nr:AMP-binding protein [Mangrovibacterium marinum]PTN08752.1 long-chain acyl-CoA synthetase [Mangrovibacterium marinum]
MSENKRLTLPAMLRTSFEKYHSNDALMFAGEEPMTYNDLRMKVERLGRQLRKLGVQQGSKVAILSANMPNWVVSFFASSAIGAVVVPILPDFSASEIKNILDHAEAEFIFVSELLQAKINREELPALKVIRIEEFREVEASGRLIELPQVDDDSFDYTDVQEQDLLSIIYTSGTTGKSKGVMLTHKNIVWTAQQSIHLQFVDSSDRFLSVLPLSHTFENTLGLIFPIMNGCSIAYLRKAPTASVLLPALKQVKPTLMLVVPLIIEKIYKGKILPQINSKALTRTLYKIRPFQKLLSRAAGKKLLETFGGELKFFGIGGAKLDNEVERFLMDAKFPLAIGYGLTETSPLLAGAVGDNVRYLSTGVALKGVQLRIANADPATGEGEVQARGENVMKGYYKEPGLTRDVFTEDGWFKTGDLGKFDKGSLFIKGRIKNMILGASGENIYPEEIESVINRMEYVLESLVVQQKGRLVAMVHLNMEEIEARFKQAKEEAVLKFNSRVDEILADIQQKVNEEVNKFSRIQTVVLQPVPFEKTPTMKIKRFLYL